MADEKKDEKKKYRIKEGMTFGAQNQYKAGDMVELTDEEAAGALDKVEPVDEPKAPAVPKAEASPPKKP